ncbi:zinc finger family protein [Stylonychia lemnae]|uniref:RING-type E3 ubiquitin transferase n=1 Tax=Stylonychia lemnae TaxID=5949 RepID=A0A078AWX3_STYLE|nr:zinc finger family protein [Stylonychia lemnae]|eukprot:CDW86556.1 zinc finger family protein [Stylonychia lemnae]
MHDRQNRNNPDYIRNQNIQEQNRNQLLQQKRNNNVDEVFLDVDMEVFERINQNLQQQNNDDVPESLDASELHTIQCPMCNDELIQEFADEHLCPGEQQNQSRSNRSQQVISYNCPQCGMVCENQVDLDDHLQAHFLAEQEDSESSNNGSANIQPAQPIQQSRFYDRIVRANLHNQNQNNRSNNRPEERKLREGSVRQQDLQQLHRERSQRNQSQNQQRLQQMQQQMNQSQHPNNFHQNQQPQIIPMMNPNNPLNLSMMRINLNGQQIPAQLFFNMPQGRQVQEMIINGGPRFRNRFNQMNHQNLDFENMNEQQLFEYFSQLDSKLNDRPLDDDIIDQLPQQQFHKRNNSNNGNKNNKADSDENKCTVCMMEFEEGDELITLTCFHKYHNGCIKEWFHRQNFCPICRTKIDLQ